MCQWSSDVSSPGSEVPKGGIEPPRSEGSADFESAASASSATSASGTTIVLADAPEGASGRGGMSIVSKDQNKKAHGWGITAGQGGRATSCCVYCLRGLMRPSGYGARTRCRRRRSLTMRAWWSARDRSPCRDRRSSCDHCSRTGADCRCCGASNLRAAGFHSTSCSVPLPCSGSPSSQLIARIAPTSRMSCLRARHHQRRSPHSCG